MNAAFTRLERHERGIHAVSAEPDRAAGPGEPADADADALSQGEPALVAAYG